ncbi:hypothetical protein [Alicyclobacillus acidiphilus]|jgi:hypothetical protein|uniref:hypothetical protein n=1 Tax=Alicyclobacillus acidiphilus TaxID=182455 RepID=UPI000A9E2B45|nr:hypothetical protein [Alicyclobacillus acidiphilus]
MQYRQPTFKGKDIRVHFVEEEDDEDLLEMVEDLPGFDEHKRDEPNTSEAPKA